MIILATRIDGAIESSTYFSTDTALATRQIKSRFLLLRATIEYGMANTHFEIGKTTNDKPYLTNHPDFQFSISYSDIYVICAVGNAEVGADIEQIRTVNLNDYREYLSTTEYYQLAALPATEQMLRFFELWTLKESYLKMTGEGLSGLHHGLSMQFSEGRWWLWQNGVRNKEVYLQCYYPTPNHVAAICSYELPADAIIWVD